jgi:hypothetical protein
MPVLGMEHGSPATKYPRKGIDLESLEDYLGLPVNGDGLLENISALWCRGYNLIWNEWFRSQDLQEKVTVDTGDGPDITDYKLLKRCKTHDYFTSALPWPQKGPSLPLFTGADAAVFGNGLGLGLTDGTQFASPFQNASLVLRPAQNLYSQPVGTTIGGATQFGTNDKGIGVVTKALAGVHPEYSGLYADMSTVNGNNINELRMQFQIQRLLERDARGGTRYVEQLKSHFGVTSPDFRLQRPEILSTASTRINVHPVQQTSVSGTGAQEQKGSLAAYAVSSSQNGFSKSFVEHGIVLGLVSVRADLTYQNGVNRMFTRRTRLDHYLPVMANLGEQEILKKELWAVGCATYNTPEVTDIETWGYQERWAEYRYKPSIITGKFRSIIGAGLDIWHLSQDYDELPPLNTSFIQDTPPIERVVSVTSEPQIIFDSYFDYKCARVMPTYSVPGLIDHL